MTDTTVDRMLKFYDDTSDNFSFSTPLHTEIIQSNTHLLSSILDFGCGYGRVLEDLGKKGYSNLYGIDASQKFIKRAQKDNSVINYAHSQNIHHFERKFDCIILNNILVNICFEKDQDQILQEIPYLLNKEGKVIIIDFIISDNSKYLDSYKTNLLKYGENGIYEKKGCLFKHHTPERVEKIRNFFQNTEYSENIVPSLGGEELRQFIIVGSI